MRSFFFCLCFVASHPMITLSAEWKVDDWYLKGTDYSFSYPVLNVVPGDSITFEWNVTTHGINDVWIFPSRDCDNETGAILLSYTSPAIYNFTEADVGKTVFFVNSIGVRCRNGVSLFANVTGNVTHFIDSVIESGNNSTGNGSATEKNDTAEAVGLVDIAESENSNEEAKVSAVNSGTMALRMIRSFSTTSILLSVFL
mmetsp:Transcript_3497/g.5582  ORF Transcript_3497/g.5582 Transcript_3497/m.5582 type:complete len:199 (-) Transcript_3497:2159-2755(-)